MRVELNNEIAIRNYEIDLIYEEIERLKVIQDSLKKNVKQFPRGNRGEK